MVCATVEMLSLTPPCCPFLRSKSRKRCVRLLQAWADWPPIDCFKQLTFRWLEGLSASETGTSDDGYLPMSIGITTEESDLKSNPGCGWLITDGWGGEDMAR
jgi:hypothetical protein